MIKIQNFQTILNEPIQESLKSKHNELSLHLQILFVKALSVSEF